MMRHRTIIFNRLFNATIKSLTDVQRAYYASDNAKEKIIKIFSDEKLKLMGLEGFKLTERIRAYTKSDKTIYHVYKVEIKYKGGNDEKPIRIYIPFSIRLF